jgi:hypothetical protein
LNYESTEWWPKLKLKCQKDCTAGRLWNALAHPPASQIDGTLLTFETFWTKDENLTPGDEALCKSGCNVYHKCMKDTSFHLK